MSSDFTYLAFAAPNKYYRSDLMLVEGSAKESTDSQAQDWSWAIMLLIGPISRPSARVFQVLISGPKPTS